MCLLLSEQQTLHLSVAGFGGDGARPVAIAAARYRVVARTRVVGRAKAAHAACRAGCVRRRVQCALPWLADARAVTRPALPPQVRKMARKTTEGGVGYAVLHAARLLWRDFRVHPGVAEQPPEELVLLERGAGEAVPSGGEPHVAVDDVNKALSRQVGERLGHARLGDAHMLRDVDVSAAPALGADDEDRLEVVLGGITDAETGRTLVRTPTIPYRAHWALSC